MTHARAATAVSVLSLAALALGASPAHAAPSVVGVDALSEVRPEGARVVAVAVEYTEALPADLDVALDSLTVTVGDASRSVVSAYPSSDPATDPGGEPGETGRFLVVELDPADAAAGAVLPDELVGQYVVSQAGDLTDDGGTVVLPAFEIANRAVRTAVADDFAAGALTGSSGATLSYRLFSPEGVVDDDGASPVPLVVFLHGGGEVGDDNVRQLTANQGAIAFASPQWQAGHPAYVLAPQLPLPADTQWESPDIQATLTELVDGVASRAAIDDDRVYLAGLSRGARGALQLLPRLPDRFAGALLAAGRASQSGGTSHVAALVDLPLWATHSVDDDIVDHADSLAFVATLEEAGAVVTRGTWSGGLPAAEAETAAAQLLAQAQAQGSHTLFTTFEPGTTPESPHHSWIPTFGNDTMLEWLFSQVRVDEPVAEPTAAPTGEPTPAPTDAAPTPAPTSASPVEERPSAPVDGGQDGRHAGRDGGRLPTTGVGALAPGGLAVVLLGGGLALLRLRRVGR